MFVRISESVNSNLIYSTTKSQMKISYSIFFDPYKISLSLYHRYMLEINKFSNYCYKKTYLYFFLTLLYSFSLQRKRKNSIKSINKELIFIGFVETKKKKNKIKRKHKDLTILFLPSKQITPQRFRINCINETCFRCLSFLSI